jgi:hypothetical protein
MKQAKRHFGMLDAMILVAFTALGFAWCKAYWLGVPPPPPSPFDLDLDVEQAPAAWPWSFHFSVATLSRFSSYCIAAWTIAFLALRIRKPRARLSRLCRSLGTAACFTVLIVLAVGFAARLTAWAFLFTPLAVEQARRMEFIELLDDLAGMLSSSAGPAIIATWGVLRLGRRLRLERDWVEVFGLVLAFGWILLVWAKALRDVLY